jgi:hypothetical protein
MFTPWGAPIEAVRLEPGLTGSRAIRFGEYYTHEIGAALGAPTIFIGTFTRTVVAASEASVTLEELIEGAKEAGKLTFCSAPPQFSNQQLFKVFTNTNPFVKAEVVRTGGPVS